MEISHKTQLSSSWNKVLSTEFDKDYMKSLRSFLRQEKRNNKQTFPKASEVFSALNITAFEKVKVVILGQDPYHGADQAHGLAFSVVKGTKTPPSLRNIYKELKLDLNIPIPNHGYLKQWAEQGVLLLNSVLTVEQSKAGSHQNQGWEKFTDKIIAELNLRSDPLVFMLWGSYAQKKGQFIDRNRHLVLSSAHPSPLSAYRGFFGNKHFSKANAFLLECNQKPIDWQLKELQ